MISDNTGWDMLQRYYGPYIWFNPCFSKPLSKGSLPNPKGFLRMRSELICVYTCASAKADYSWGP